MSLRLSEFQIPTVTEASFTNPHDYSRSVIIIAGSLSLSLSPMMVAARVPIVILFCVCAKQDFTPSREAWQRRLPPSLLKRITLAMDDKDITTRRSASSLPLSGRLSRQIVPSYVVERYMASMQWSPMLRPKIGYCRCQSQSTMSMKSVIREHRPKHKLPHNFP